MSGRNVALKQEGTEQSTTHRNWIASHAVDGSRGDGYYRSANSQTCTQTRDRYFYGSQGTWSLRFSHPVVIYKYVIYNRYDCCQYWLNGFFLETWGTDGNLLFPYRDNHTEGRKLVYTVVPESSIGTPVSSIRFTSNNDEYILILCEVEVYGEVACPQGKYGRECEHNCNCADQTSSCLVSTGGCTSGCASGYIGEDCKTECPRGKHGLRCKETCSSHCENNKTCNHVDGHCPEGCKPGYEPPFCKDECPSSKYGQDCAMDCSTKCVDSKCDHVTGHCGECFPGYVGDHCDQQCEAGKFGQNCTTDCSRTCLDRNCDYVTGHCEACLPGYGGELCDEIIQETTSFAPYGIAAAILVIGVVAFSLMALKYRKLKRHSHERENSQEDSAKVPGVASTSGKLQEPAEYLEPVNKRADPTASKEQTEEEYEMIGDEYETIAEGQIPVKAVAGKSGKPQNQKPERAAAMKSQTSEQSRLSATNKTNNSVTSKPKKSQNQKLGTTVASTSDKSELNNTYANEQAARGHNLANYESLDVNRDNVYDNDSTYFEI